MSGPGRDPIVGKHKVTGQPVYQNQTTGALYTIRHMHVYTPVDQVRLKPKAKKHR